MKKETTNYRLHDYPYSSKRFLVSLFDAVILLLTSFGMLLLVMNAILPNISSYQSRVDNIEKDRISMLKISEEAGLTSYKDGDYEKPQDVSTMYQRYVGQHILLSYQLEPEIWEVAPVIEGLEKATFDNDIFSQFYVNYVSKYNDYNGHNNDIINLNGLTNKAYLQKILRDSDTSLLAWATSEYKGSDIDSEEFLYLKAAFAQNLYLAVFKGESSSEISSSHNYFYSKFESLWKNATNELTESTRFVDVYNTYQDNYVFCSHIASLVTVLVYIVCFLIVFLLPSLLFKNNRGTFGYRIFSLAVVNDNKESPHLWQVLVRNLILLISNLPTLLIASFLSGGLSSSLMFPLFNRGPSLLQILIIAAVIPVVDMFMVSLSHRHKSIAEWASKTVIVDARKSTAVIEEKKEDEDYTHSEIQRVINDLPYIDSSTIPEEKEEKK